ncbi:Uncharacterised protein [uncultured archaeon]|nr:Uncharacterised protein [uncultured archaeon]
MDSDISKAFSTLSNKELINIIEVLMNASKTNSAPLVITSDKERPPANPKIDKQSYQFDEHYLFVNHDMKNLTVFIAGTEYSIKRGNHLSFWRLIDKDCIQEQNIECQETNSLTQTVYRVMVDNHLRFCLTFTIGTRLLFLVLTKIKTNVYHIKTRITFDTSQNQVIDHISKGCCKICSSSANVNRIFHICSECFNHIKKNPVVRLSYTSDLNSGLN